MKLLVNDFLTNFFHDDFFGINRRALLEDQVLFIANLGLLDAAICSKSINCTALHFRAQLTTPVAMPTLRKRGKYSGQTSILEFVNQ